MSFSSRFSRNHPQRTAKRILPRMLMFWICLPARALRPALFTGGHRIRMRIPAPRGHGGHGGAGRAGRHVGGTSACVLRDEDLQLSLLCRYELHHSGLDTVPDSLKWHQGLVGLRLDREAAFEAARRHTGHRPLPQPLPSPPTPPTAEVVAAELFRMAADDDGPSASRRVVSKTSLEQLQEFLILRSIDQLREAGS